jgi:hypothetical protein
VALDGRSHAVDFCDVNSQPDNHSSSVAQALLLVLLS